jgi:hypothetical protein
MNFLSHLCTSASSVDKLLNAYGRIVGWTPTTNFVSASTSPGGRWRILFGSSGRGGWGSCRSVLAPGRGAGGAGRFLSGCSRRLRGNPLARGNCPRRLTTRAVEPTTSTRAGGRRRPGRRRWTDSRNGNCMADTTNYHPGVCGIPLAAPLSPVCRSGSVKWRAGPFGVPQGDWFGTLVTSSGRCRWPAGSRGFACCSPDGVL